MVALTRGAVLRCSIDKLDKLVIQYPKTPEYWLQRGKYKLEKDFLPGAEKDFDKVLSLDEDFEGLGKWAVIEKAVVYKKKKLYSKGLAMLSALAEELDETFLEASVKVRLWYQMGINFGRSMILFGWVFWIQKINQN